MIKLTDTNNSTLDGIPFPTTPDPEIYREPGVMDFINDIKSSFIKIFIK